MRRTNTCRAFLFVFAIFEQVNGFVSSKHYPTIRASTCFNTRSSPLKQSLDGKSVNDDVSSLSSRILDEAKELSECLSIAAKALVKKDTSVTAQDIVLLCDEIDEINTPSTNMNFRKAALEFKRYEYLCKLMRHDYDAYIATASFLSPSRIPRSELPNVQDVPFPDGQGELVSSIQTLSGDDGEDLVADCELEDMEFKDNFLDKLLLSTFRKLVKQNTGGVVSPKAGIEGLLEQGRTFMLQPGQTAEAQHKMVKDTLGGLMTPVLPPFYRIFMSGIIPKLGTEYDGKQIGPWFYAPFLTSVVTPTFFGFLVGPSKPNRRKDGRLGGLVVEKCKFLQQSGCKGLCLHQCKIPAQEFFQEELGLPLTVTPNFVTQECQWSFGETPLPASEDPSFPKGCLAGCESRKAVKGTFADLCN